MIEHTKKAQILALLAKGGKSDRAIAREVGDVSYMTVSRLRRATECAAAAPAVASLAPVVASVEPVEHVAVADLSPGETVAVLRDVLAREQAAYRACRAEGDALGAQRAARTMSALAPTIERSERASRSAEDVVVFSRAEIEEGTARVEAMMRTLASEPLYCARCGREVRASWANEPT